MCFGQIDANYAYFNSYAKSSKNNILKLGYCERIG